MHADTLPLVSLQDQVVETYETSPFRRRGGRAFLGGDLSISRQRRYQIRMQASGRCRTCGKPRGLSIYHCDAHAIADRERHRAKAGHQPWERGHVGRPPLVKERA